MSWPVVKLGSLFKVTSGGTPSRSVAEYYEDGQIPWVKTGDLHNKYVEQASEYITEAGLKSSSTRLYPAGTVLVAMYGATIGACSILAIEACTNQACAAFTPNPQVDVDYLYYFLKHSKTAFVNAGAGGAQPNISAGFLKEYEIPLPPLAEQKRIAAILDKADAIRRKRQQTIQLADDFLRAVFLQMFGDPVTNPKGWDVKPLGEITSFENGDRSSNYPSGEDVVNSGVLFLSTKNIVADSLDLRHKQFITEDKFNQLSRGKARKGDLIITLRGTLGACCIFDCEYEKAFINAQMMIIRPEKELVAGFLHDFLVTESIKSHFQRIGQGAAVPQLTAKQFKELLIPLPTLELQLKYETIRRFVLATTVKLSGREEQDFFNSLSQKAFSGQL